MKRFHLLTLVLASLYAGVFIGLFIPLCSSFNAAHDAVPLALIATVHGLFWLALVFLTQAHLSDIEIQRSIVCGKRIRVWDRTPFRKPLFSGTCALALNFAFILTGILGKEHALSKMHLYIFFWPLIWMIVSVVGRFLGPRVKHQPPVPPPSPPSSSK